MTKRLRAASRDNDHMSSQEAGRAVALSARHQQQVLLRCRSDQQDRVPSGSPGRRRALSSEGKHPSMPSASRGTALARKRGGRSNYAAASSQAPIDLPKRRASSVVSCRRASGYVRATASPASDDPSPTPDEALCGLGLVDDRDPPQRTSVIGQEAIDSTPPSTTGRSRSAAASSATADSRTPSEMSSGPLSPSAGPATT